MPTAFKTLLFTVCLLPLGLQAQHVTPEHQAGAQIIMEAATGSSVAWDRLTEFVDYYPHRLSGSQMLEDGIDWIAARMRADGLDNVRKQPVMVPNWKRGSEHLKLLSPAERELPMLGLGNSVGTGPDGITANVIVVGNYDEMKARADEIQGNIVLFNVPFTTYGGTVQFRVNGLVEAARLGAAAVLIRSVTPFSMQTPHTGTTRYADDVPKIPGAAITPEDALWMHRMAQRGETIRVHLYMEAAFEEDALSHNLVAELRGSEKPDEIIVIGGHIDGWDVGQGAMDDAGGSIISWEVIRLLKELNLRPKRTIRVVLWTNEENGLQGAYAYRDSVIKAGEMEKHVLAIESDAGVFKPHGFGINGSDEAFRIITEIGKLLEPIEAGYIRRGGGGADIGPLNQAGRVPIMGLNVDGTRYFWYHHTHADTIDKLKKEEVQACVAAMAVMAWVVAELDAAIPR